MRESYRIHRPIQNLYAHTYVLLMLLAFAFTVVGTRLFLDVTGYPQVGNETFHVAHALWGGLFLVIAAILMLTYVNRWVFQVAAILAGVGVGLFIDEVGKFITQTNDYFFPLAAPLIYVFYLLAVFTYLYVRRSTTSDARAELYDALALIQEVLDDDLEAGEHEYLVEQLRSASRSDRRELSLLAQALLVYVESEAAPVIPNQRRWPQRLLAAWHAFEERRLPRRSFRRLLILALTLFTGNAFLQTTALLAFVVNRSALTGTLWTDLITSNPQVRGEASLTWFLVSVALEFLMGVLLALAVAFFMRRRDLTGVRVAATSLVISLTVTNILKFYFNQFSVIAESLLLFAMLVALIRYQNRFLREFPSAL